MERLEASCVGRPRLPLVALEQARRGAGRAGERIWGRRRSRVRAAGAPRRTRTAARACSPSPPAAIRPACPAPARASRASSVLPTPAGPSIRMSAPSPARARTNPSLHVASSRSRSSSAATVLGGTPATIHARPKIHGKTLGDPPLRTRPRPLRVLSGDRRDRAQQAKGSTIHRGGLERRTRRDDRRAGGRRLRGPHALPRQRSARAGRCAPARGRPPPRPPRPTRQDRGPGRRGGPGRNALAGDDSPHSPRATVALLPAARSPTQAFRSSGSWPGSKSTRTPSTRT